MNHDATPMNANPERYGESSWPPPLPLGSGCAGLGFNEHCSQLAWQSVAPEVALTAVLADWLDAGGCAMASCRSTDAQTGCGGRHEAIRRRPRMTRTHIEPTAGAKIAPRRERKVPPLRAAPTLRRGWRLLIDSMRLTPRGASIPITQPRSGVGPPSTRRSPTGSLARDARTPDQHVPHTTSPNRRRTARGRSCGRPAISRTACRRRIAWESSPAIRSPACHAENQPCSRAQRNADRLL